jgi:hypothetical protein
VFLFGNPVARMAVTLAEHWLNIKLGAPHPTHKPKPQKQIHPSRTA